MSPPLPVTEDTPPDMLAGSMDLRVVLPGGHNVKMSVDRSTPMMDLLVQVTTANKISPGGHVIQALGERGVLPYKPSTPIGALDTWTIHIVPKHQMANSGIKKAPLKPVNQPFEQTFRLQVHLPRNQLYVSRVSPKARLSDILLQVCSEKNLDCTRYSLRHPTNLDQVLNLKCTLADYKLQEVTLVYNTTLPVEVSTVDIMALQRDASNNYINRNNRSCEGSVSSGSLGGRSLSPVPSDESSASPPPPPPSRPIRKRRPAPKPPTINNTINMNGTKLQKESESSKSTTVICHSRNSSDSSGYHEASVLSESPQSNSLPDSLPRRSKLPSITSESELSESSREVNSNNLSRSLSSLTAVENLTTVSMRQYQHSISTSSLSAVGGRKKKAAPPPPPTVSKMSSLSEEQQRTPSVSSTASSTTTLDGNEASVLRKSATLPASGRLPSISAVDIPEYIPSSPVDASSLEPPQSPVQAPTPVPKPLPRSVSTESSQSSVKYRAPLPKPRYIIDQSITIEEKQEMVKSILHRSQSDGTAMEEINPKPVYLKRNQAFSSIQKSHKALIDELAGKLKKTNSFDDGDSSSSDSTITNNSDSVQNGEPTSAMSSTSNVFFDGEVSTETKLKETVSDADLLNKDKHDELPMGRNVSVSCLQEANSMSSEPGRLGRWKNIECLVETQKEPTAWVLGSKPESSPEPISSENAELRLADEEIDRIFHNATRDHTSLESGVGDEPPLSLLSLPSPPASLTHKDVDTHQNTDPLDWEYQLPAPPTFRDESNSPSVTEYGTLTIGNLTEVFGPPSLSQTVTTEHKTELEKVVEEDKSVLKEEIVKKSVLVENINKINQTKRLETQDTITKISRESKISDDTIEKSVVINELSSVITERLNRPESIVEPVKKNSQELISPSTLDNFTISTYKDTKPIEVFEDESIKSSVGEKRDTSKDDALFRAPKARIAEPNLTRTNSFSTEDKSFHPTVKRSVSYVSLLAANMPRTSQPYRAHLAKSNLALAENGSDMLRKEVWPRLRKTSSELNISRESNEHKHLFGEHTTSWQKIELQNNDLQSLQVLRSILPQLSQSQSASDVVETSKPSDEPDRVASISETKVEDTLVENQVETESKLENKVLKNVNQSHEKTKHTFPVDDENLNKETLYKYSGPPTINLSTWSERPKRQVSIKNDRDYVIGVGKKETNSDENQTQKPEVVKETPKPVEQSNIMMRLVSRTNSRTERPKSAIDLGHVPIVRAVELKKPFVSSNIGLGYTQQGKLISNQTSVEDSLDESFAGVNSLAQRFGQSKPRPVSSYLFGSESEIKPDDGKGTVQSQTGVSKVVLNAGKKFTSIVGINGPESKTEVKMTGDKQMSRIHIGGVEERKLKLNTALPNKIDYTSSSDIKALSKIRSGGIIDPSSPVEALDRPDYSQPSTNKSPSIDSSNSTMVTNTSPVSPNVVNPRSWKSSTVSYSRSNSSRSNSLSPSSVSSSLKNTPTTPLSPKTNLFFGSNTIERSGNIRPNNFPLPVVKGFRTTETNESSGGIPPPPPVMPLLKPVNSKKSFNTLPLPAKDPRDQLLESIRSFGKDGLKKISK